MGSQWHLTGKWMSSALPVALSVVMLEGLGQTWQAHRSYSGVGREPVLPGNTPAPLTTAWCYACDRISPKASNLTRRGRIRLPCTCAVSVLQTQVWQHRQPPRYLEALWPKLQLERQPRCLWTTRRKWFQHRSTRGVQTEKWAHRELRMCYGDAVFDPREVSP